MIEVLLLIGGALVAVALSGFFSGTEMGVYTLNTVRLRVDHERGVPAARRLLPMMDRFENLVSSALIGTNIADYLASAFVTALMIRAAVGGAVAEFYTVAIVTPAILVFGNIVPKEQFRRDPNGWMAYGSLPLALWCQLTTLTGLPAALRGLSRTVLRWIDPSHTGQERGLYPSARTLQLLREGAERGGLTLLQRDLFDRVMSLSRLRVSRVMVPRQRAALIPDTTTRADLLRIARMAHFSRLPVYRGDPRRVIGVINVFDVFVDEAERELDAYLRGVVTLRSTDTVPVALRKLQQARDVMAIVTDARGRCVGLLTMKDLVEEIVGDLEAW